MMAEAGMARKDESSGFQSGLSQVGGLEAGEYSSANAIMQGYFFALTKVLLGFQTPVFQGCIIME